jgi:FkbM family methyltransferase
MGALDGVRQSNSEQLDNRLGWHGLLLEANEEMCKQLFTNRPRALKICSGCCTEESPSWFQFESTDDPFVSAAVHAMDKNYKEHYHTFRDGQKVVTRKHQVPCQALGRILRGHGVTDVDFFSLDVEGAELEASAWSQAPKLQ